MNQAYFLGQAESDEVAYADRSEHNGKEGKGGRRGIEISRVRLYQGTRRSKSATSSLDGMFAGRRTVAITHQSHCFAEDIHQGLVGHGDGAGEKEKAQRDMKERERGDDGLCRYQRHDAGLCLPNPCLKSGHPCPIKQDELRFCRAIG